LRRSETACIGVAASRASSAAWRCASSDGGDGGATDAEAADEGAAVNDDDADADIDAAVAASAEV
jgi:hypothetical protein